MVRLGRRVRVELEHTGVTAAAPRGPHHGGRRQPPLCLYTGHCLQPRQRGQRYLLPTPGGGAGAIGLTRKSQPRSLTVTISASYRGSSPCVVFGAVFTHTRAARTLHMCAHYTLSPIPESPSTCADYSPERGARSPSLGLFRSRRSSRSRRRYTLETETLPLAAAPSGGLGALSCTSVVDTGRIHSWSRTGCFGCGCSGC
eukprot:8865958-Pyramimonas_sp.AAC.1